MGSKKDIKNNLKLIEAEIRVLQVRRDMRGLNSQEYMKLSSLCEQKAFYLTLISNP